VLFIYIYSKYIPITHISLKVFNIGYYILTAYELVVRIYYLIYFFDQVYVIVLYTGILIDINFFFSFGYHQIVRTNIKLFMFVYDI